MGVTVLGIQHKVALRKESVDRNSRGMNITFCIIVSLSARRAWIEIICEMRCFLCLRVALRKESVDRNIQATAHLTVRLKVALRKESVDRNCMGVAVLGIQHRRSPQGERG